MSRQPPNTDELDFGCDCPNHDASTWCASCRPDLCNTNLPAGTNICYSTSAPNSANLTPASAPRDIYGRQQRSDPGNRYMSGALAQSATPTSTPSSGQGPSRGRRVPVHQQPVPHEGMQYPPSSYGSGTYEGVQYAASPYGGGPYGTMGAGYSGLAQSPASYTSGAQNFYEYGDNTMSGDGSGSGSYQQGHGEHWESERKSRDKGKGKAKKH